MDIVELGTEHENSFLAMISDYQTKAPAELAQFFPAIKWTPEEFRKFVKECTKEKYDWRPGPGKISVTRYVLLDPQNRMVLANGILRFPLDAVTEIEGGNLFCDVSPSIRGKGCGSFVLSRLLFEAVRAGLRRVLVTCPEGDAVARRVIEKNRGVLLDIAASPGSAGGKICRYWIRFD